MDMQLQLVARLYAEISFISVLLLLVALLSAIGDMPHGSVCLATVASIAYLLLTADDSSYY